MTEQTEQTAKNGQEQDSYEDKCKNVINTRALSFINNLQQYITQLEKEVGESNSVEATYFQIAESLYQLIFSINEFQHSIARELKDHCWNKGMPVYPHMN